ncbi:hypothetical protein FO519_004852 [Halicephalobus sp. NKZ332]|nr:hypothetical protein FO519_004852 [Halicephalobus sp. NKZ332]
MSHKKSHRNHRPFYLDAISGFLKAFFFVYDIVVFLPFKVFANPNEKKAISSRIKAEPIVEKDPGSPWRNVEVMGRPLKKLVFLGCPTLGSVWDRAASMYPNELCMGWRDVHEASEEEQLDGKMFQKLVLGDYKWMTYNEVEDQIQKIQVGLWKIGIRQGDKIVIFAETRKEWMMTAIACFKLGVPVVTVYATLGEEAVAYAMNECDAVACVTVNSLLPKVFSAVKNIPSIKKIVYFHELYQNPGEEKTANKSVVQLFKDIDCDVYSLEEIMELKSEEDAVETDVKPDELAMIMYTSGTTGNPKGVMLSHRNIVAALAGQSSVIPIGPDDTVIGYLPLAHILEVCAEMVCLGKGCKIGYSSAQTLFDRAPKIKKGSKGDCAALKPTVMACVPAVMDRIYKAVHDEVRQSSVVSRELFRICYERKRARYEDGYTSLIMNRLVFNKIRRLLGGELRAVLSGGAPLNPETQRFMNICFCCPVVQGYGLTETCGGGTLADQYDLSTGSVGPPLTSCEIMLREWSDGGYSPRNKRPQGEILIHGDHVAVGYYKNDEKTKEDFVEIDGKRWFATGDIGEFREDGALRIIDRKKDLIKLAHGEYISLGKVESTLLTNSFVDNICIVGNLRRDYLIALVVPNEKNVRELAKNHNIDINDWKVLCNNKTVCELVTHELQAHAKGKLLRSEVPQKVHLCDEPWTPSSGLLTEALKLKRKNIEKTYEKEIAHLFH